MRFDLWRSNNEIRYRGKKGKKTTPRSCAKFNKTFLGLISWFIRSYCSRFTATGERKKQYQLFAESNPWFIVFFSTIEGVFPAQRGLRGPQRGLRDIKGGWQDYEATPGVWLKQLSRRRSGASEATRTIRGEPRDLGGPQKGCTQGVEGFHW